MIKVKLSAKKMIYLAGGFLSLLVVYVTGKDADHYKTFSAADLLGKEARADIPYIQSSYYSQATYYSQSGYGDDDDDDGGGGSCGSCGCSSCGGDEYS